MEAKSSINGFFLCMGCFVGKILTAENLRKRNIILVSWCYLCKGDGETADHLLPSFFDRVVGYGFCPFRGRVGDVETVGKSY
jgi:hypothetical protein